MTFVRLALSIVLACSLSALGGELPRSNDAPPALKKVESKYYWIYTDLGDMETREAAMRLSRMAETYAARTAGFAGVIRTKFPVYLFRHDTDYYNAGGMPGSAGMFDGRRLMIIAGTTVDGSTWHTMQHEGFHQFAHAVIGGDLPTWVDEGLAEYFGEGVWTGDGFETGLIPPWRLQRVRRTIAQGDFVPVTDLMGMENREWNNNLSIEHYDQAWSMVHFLVHAEDGRYRKAFSAYMNQIGSGKSAKIAWQREFGDTAGFEEKWVAYWKGLSVDPTALTYNRAAAATIGSFWGRLLVRKQAVADYPALEKLAKTDTLGLKNNASDWLPTSLLQGAIKTANAAGDVQLQLPKGRSPVVILTCKDGSRAIATVELHGTTVKSVTTTVDDSALALAEAKRLFLVNEKPKAMALLRDALKRNPQSPLAGEIRQLLQPPKPSKGGAGS
jgi:hypothetical protein